MLKRLKIRNFRSYSNEEVSDISFEPGINTIVGKNNVGKSTIFQSLMYAKGELDVNPTDYFAGITNGTSRVELQVKLAPSEISTFFRPLIAQAVNQKQIIQHQVKKFPDIIHIRHGNSYRTKMGSLWIEGSKIYNKPIDRSKKLRVRRNWDTSFLKELEHESLEYLINNLLKDAHKEINESIDSKIDLQNTLLNLFKRKLKIFPEFRHRPGGEDRSIIESYDGTEVAAVLNTLKNGNTEQIRKWRRIQNSFSQFYPNLILDVRKPPGSNPVVWIEKEDIDYDVTIDKIGAGISEFIVFITHLIDSQEYIFCLDNSEIHFHPHAQRKLIDLIKKYSLDNQFLLVTHSSNLIDFTSLQKISVVREKKGCSLINQLKPRWFTKTDLHKIERNMTLKMKEIFFSDFVFFVEGPTETGALPIFANTIGKNFDNQNISMVEVAGKYFDIPIKICKGFDLPYLVMCDKDALMNIETHFGRGNNRLECSPIIRLLLNLKLLTKNERELISSLDSIEEKNGRKYYKKELFIILRKIAKKHNVFVLSSKFETILKRAGYTKYFEEITNQGIRSKPIIGKYVAQKITENSEPIPDQFLDVLNMIP